MAKTNCFKKAFKIVFISVGTLIVLYFVFILLMYYTPLWKYLPAGLRSLIVKSKIANDQQFVNTIKILTQDEQLSAQQIAYYYQIAVNDQQPLVDRKEALNELRLAGVFTPEVVALEKAIASDPQADADFKYIALKALGQSADGDYSVLLTAIKQESGPAGIIAAQSLGQQAGSEIVPQLLAIAVDETESPSIIKNAIISLDEMALQKKLNKQQITEIMTKIKPLLQHKKYIIRESASSTLNTLTGKQYEIKGPTEEEAQNYVFGG